MKTVCLTELGFFAKSQCEKIKGFMEGRTYMNFHVSYSNCAGNCTLMCSTNYKASESEIKNFFVSSFFHFVAS